MLHEGHDLAQLDRDILGHIGHGHALDLDGRNLARFDVFGLMGIDFAEAFVVDEDVGDDTAFEFAAVHDPEQNFLKILKLLDVHTGFPAVHADHLAPPFGVDVGRKGFPFPPTVLQQPCQSDQARSSRTA